MAVMQERRWRRILAVGAWMVSISVFAVQVWVVPDATAQSARTIFPAWPHNTACDGCLRAIAWADILLMQSLLFLIGVGLWR